jgi:uncharacterized protein
MIDNYPTILITLLFFATAMLYSSVGLAGATSYLAVMALFGFPPEEMKSTALVLNVLVATIATIKFIKAGCFSWQNFWPFAITSIPFAYLGGRIMLPAMIYKSIVCLVLFYTAYRLLRLQSKRNQPVAVHPAPLWAALLCGAGIGFVAGLSGIGGGIFLSPLLLITGWAEVHIAIGTAAAFNLVNSLAGLVGHSAVVSSLPAALPLWALAAGIGGWVGAEYGSRKLASHRLQQILALILAIAGVRMIFL